MDETVPRANRPDRAGLKTIVTYVPQDVARRIKVIAAQTDRTVQQIGEEAIMDWLKKRGEKFDLPAAKKA